MAEIARSNSILDSELPTQSQLAIGVVAKESYILRGKALIFDVGWSLQNQVIELTHGPSLT